MGMNRRSFLKIMAAATSAVAAGACDVKESAPKIIPYVVPPEEEIVPGFPLYYKSALAELPDQPGVTVTAYDKVIGLDHVMCPTKLEGTPGHPVNDGALTMQGQAELYRLYSPQRLQKPSVMREGGLKPVTWEAAIQQVADEMKKAAAAGKKNVFLSGKTTGSPGRLIDQFCQVAGVERAREFEPFSYAAIRKANGLLFGDAAVPQYKITSTDFLLTIGADIMETFVSPVNYAKQFTAARLKNGLHWHHAGAHVTSTGLRSDARYDIIPGSEPWLLAFILRHVIANGLAKNKISDDLLAALPDESVEAVSQKTGIEIGELLRTVDGFEEARHPLVIAGGTATAHEGALQTAVLAGLLQWATGQISDTVDFTRAENHGHVGDLNDMKALNDSLAAGEVGVIFISRTDPVLQLPGGFGFANNLKKASLVVGMGLLPNDTIRVCNLVLPLSHSLESWGDVEPRRGILSPVQPAMKPLFDTRSEGDILIGLLQALGHTPPAPSMQEYVFAEWAKAHGADFADKFLTVGHFTADVPEAKSRIALDAAADVLKGTWPEPLAGPALLIAPSPRMHDGRFAELDGAPRQNLLRDIPDTITSITYGEWVSVPPEVAESLSLTDKLLNVDVVSVTAGGVSLKLPARIQPRLTNGVFVLQRGFTTAECKAAYQAAGFDTASGEALWYLPGAQIAKTGEKDATLCIMSGSQSQEGRGYIPFPIDEKRWEEYEKHAGLHTTGHNTHSGQRAMAVLPAKGQGGGAEAPKAEQTPIILPGESAPVQTGEAHHGPEETLEGFAKPHIGVHKGKPGGLYTGHTYPEYRWGMTVDLDLCTGCGACVAACYTENNIPVAGQEDHLKGREMSWIRIETYFEKIGETFLPMMCQHCDYAPCEPVCPVYATYHNPEGLNAMVYSRCVGTRYCFNNCPYKVRRFNWWDYKWTAPLDRMTNPMVWVREKGVMEKCTFCVQRIRAAKDIAKDDNRRQVRDGEVVTACQQTCPANAILFGNLKDENAAVTKAATSDRTYRVLEMLGVAPAVYYLHGKDRAPHGGHGHKPELPIGQEGKMPSGQGHRPDQQFQAPTLTKEVTQPHDAGTTASLDTATSPTLTGAKK